MSERISTEAVAPTPATPPQIDAPAQRPRPEVQPDRVLCVYENQPLRGDSTFAVPRLLAQLLEHLTSRYDRTEFITVSPGGGDIQGARNLSAAELGFARRLSHRVRAFMAGTRDTPEMTAPYQRCYDALTPLAGQSSPRTLVISATMSASILARELMPDARILYWVQGMPRLGQESASSRAVNSVDAVVAPSAAIYRDLFSLICRDRFAPPVWVIPNTIDSEQFQPITDTRKAEVRSRLGLGDNDAAIAHVGRAPEKGVQVVSKALSLCQYDRKNIVLISAGGEDQQRRRVSPHAEVLEVGRVSPSDLNEIYQVCDIGVVPSVWWENCPLALIEMLSLGLCVIGSRVGGIPEMIRDGESGLIVDSPNDVAAWAGAIDTCLADVDLRQRLAIEAQRSVDGRFDRRRLMSDWETVISTILSDV